MIKPILKIFQKSERPIGHRWLRHTNGTQILANVQKEGGVVSKMFELLGPVPPLYAQLVSQARRYFGREHIRNTG